MSSEGILHSRRTLCLRFDIPVARTSYFWEALKGGKFVTTKCKKCGNISFPPQADCPKCMSNEFEWFEISRLGTLVTYTQVQVIPASFVENDPYIVALADFNGIRILAWLEKIKIEQVKQGMQVKLESRISKEGNPYYVFVPA